MVYPCSLLGKRGVEQSTVERDRDSIYLIAVLYHNSSIQVVEVYLMEEMEGLFTISSFQIKNVLNVVIHRLLV